MNGSIWPSWRYRRNPETNQIEGRIFRNRNEIAEESSGGWVHSPALVDSIKQPSPVTHAPEAEKEHQDKVADPETQDDAGESSADDEDDADEVLEEDQENNDLDFSGLDDEALRDIASKAGIKVDKRWGRARIETALKLAASKEVSE